MKPDVTSRHLRTTTELTVIAPIKQGFIEYVDTVTYASRLRMLLSVLFELRKGADERSSGAVKAGSADKSLEYVGPLEQLQTLHFVQWAVFDSDTRLMLNVTFDRSWESYMRDIVDVAGPLLDIILCHCADYEGHSTDLGYQKFAEWVREHQVGNDFFYASEPSLTSDDHRYHIGLTELPHEILEQRARQQGATIAKSAPIGVDLEKALDSLRVEIPRPTSGTLEDLQRISGALFDLRRYFSAVTTPGHASYLSSSARQDLVFYDEVAYLLVVGFEDVHFKTPIDPTKPSAMLLASWYRDLRARSRDNDRACDAALAAVIPEEAVPDIQRGLLTPFAKTTHGCLVLVQWASPEAGATFLEHVRERLSLESLSGDKTINLALTFRGLKSLDLTEQELRAFPKEFREGMEARSGILGDVKASHPSTWLLPKLNWPPPPVAGLHEQQASVALSSVDAVLMLQTFADAAERDHEWTAGHPLADDLEALVKATGVQVLHVQPLRREYDGEAMIEHFGFRDDISQPHVAFKAERKLPQLARDRIAPGEVVLGYPNARGEQVRFAVDGVEAAEQDDLLRNGSFLVMRKLKQDVGAFYKFLRDGAAALGDVTEDELAAQMMGRKPGSDGAPLATITANEADDLSVAGMAAQRELNSFDFTDGRCPFHAHIRRMNPRDELPKPNSGEKAPYSNTPQRKTPRIVRRSFPYGPARGTQAHQGDSERGLMFMALNASIADQYEILQRWVSGGNSTGLPSSLADLISGASSAAAFPVRKGGETRWLSAPERPLVELQWGMYAFVPSLHAVKRLVQRGKAGGKAAITAQQQQLGARGVVIIHKLLALPDSVAKVEWKRLLENREALEDTRAIWAAVLKVYGGALRTPYGVLVAGQHNVYEVLRNSGTYSVREYWHRMADSIGPMHLGMDPEPTAMPARSASAKDKQYEAAVQKDTYRRVAEPLNAAIAMINADVGFDGGRKATRGVLKALSIHPDSGLALCDLRDLSAAVLQSVSAEAFGMPSSLAPPLPDVRSSLSDFRQCSAYVFTVNPEPWVGAGAREGAEQIRKAYRHNDYAAIANVQARHLPADPFVKNATDPSVPNPQKEAHAASLKGAAFGFLAATLGSVVSTLYQWVDSGELWRLQHALPTCRQQEPDPQQLKVDRERLEQSILKAMQRGPVPQVLHRQVVQAAQLGPVSLVPGDRVVASLATVAVDAPNDFDVMFGGDYNDPNKPVHACPGRAMALGVMAGLIWTVLRQQDIRRVSEVSALKVTFLPRT